MLLKNEKLCSVMRNNIEECVTVLIVAIMSIKLQSNLVNYCRDDSSVVISCSNECLVSWYLQIKSIINGRPRECAHIDAVSGKI